jgi:hypothetical protein
MKYYRIFSAMHEGYWRLGTPQTNDGSPVDVCLFFQEAALPYDLLYVPIEADGHRTQFTVAPIDIPVLTLDCSRILRDTIGDESVELLTAAQSMQQGPLPACPAGERG